MKHLYFRYLASLLIGLLICSLAFAGTTGKISGRVVDATTGEPLPGTNVVISNTMMGAAADMDGYYTILNVPPGLYNLSAMAIGYTKITIDEIRVRIDQTAKADFNMSMEAIEGEAVSVVADRNNLKPDVGTSVVAVTDVEVKALPISTVDQVVELQAGVEEGLEIRGGSSDEVLFQLDGVTLRDPRNNRPITGVALSAINEISVERGGFNAEYGQVRSGLINVITKEGEKDHYEATATVKYSPPTAKNFGLSPFDRNSMWSKPYLDDEVCWVGTQNGAWDEYMQRQYPQFDGWNAISNNYMTDDDPTNDLTPAQCQKLWEYQHRRRPQTDQPDYNIDAGFGGPVPFVSEKLGNLRFFTSYVREREMLLIPLSRPDYQQWDWMTSVTSDISEATKLRLSAIAGKSYNVAINADDKQFNSQTWGINGINTWDPTDYMRDPYTIAKITNEQRSGRIFVKSWYSPAEVSHQAYSTKLSHFLSDKTFFETSLEHLSRSYQSGPLATRDTTKNYEIFPGYFVDEAPEGFWYQPLSGIDGMFFGGHTSTARDSSEIASTTFKFDMTSQMNHMNLVKVGLEFVYYNLDFNYGQVKTYFGDVNYVKQKENPYRMALYAQDKLEAKGFIVNAGLRLDYSNPNTDWVEVSPYDAAFYSNEYNSEADYPKQKVDPKVSLSPRLSVSHPVTENSKLFFNYGHFKQMPEYEEIYRIGRSTNGQMRNYGDPNLALASTVSYELGYDHVISSDYLIQAAAYYHDITDQQNWTLFGNATGSVGYFLANNASYEDIRGFEFTFRKTNGQWWTAFANYTYHVSTSGQFGRQNEYESITEQRTYDRNTRNLYQQRPVPRPFGRVSATFYTPKNYGPSLLGIQVLNNWTLNFLGDWKAGEWITYNPNNVREIVNNLQVKDFFNMKLRLNKKITYKAVDLTLFMEIENLFDTKRLSGASFYDTHDQRFYFESLHLSSSRAYNNIPGDDKPGDVRKDGVAYQPIEIRGSITATTTPGTEGVIYWDRSTGKYMETISEMVDGAEVSSWVEVDKGRMDKILDDKAYIDMPNQTSFNFLNPRQFFFGVTTSIRF